MRNTSDKRSKGMGKRNQLNARNWKGETTGPFRKESPGRFETKVGLQNVPELQRS